MLSPVPDAAIVLDATHFASMKHRDQRRQDHHASPFVNHPIETASILAGVGRVRSTTILVSAILHDILEDTETSAHELEARFGTDVMRLVEELTDEPGQSTATRRDRQIARTARGSPAAKQIRLADKIANLRGLPIQWSNADGEKYIAFAERVAAAARGVNPALDALFQETAQRARSGLQQAVGDRPTRSAPRAPLRALATTGVLVPKAKVRRLHQLYSEVEELMDDIAMGRDVAEDAPISHVPRSSVPSDIGPRGSTRPRRFDDPELRRLAEPGVGAVEFRPIDARYVAVSIDGAHEFPLPLDLARLLQILVDPEGESRDGFIPFKSRREVAARLQKLTARSHADHAIVVAIGRLRGRLHDVGKANPWFVETDGSRVRMRLRRATP